MSDEFGSDLEVTFFNDDVITLETTAIGGEGEAEAKETEEEDPLEDTNETDEDGVVSGTTNETEDGNEMDNETVIVETPDGNETGNQIG